MNRNLGVARLRVVLALASLAIALGACSVLPDAGARVTRDDAIAIALKAAPRFTRADLLAAESGRLGDFIPPAIAGRLSPAPSVDHPAWRIRLGGQPSPTGGYGTEIVIDSVDGRVVLTSDWAS